MQMAHKIVPCLWFDGQAEQAAEYEVSLLPDSQIDRMVQSPADTPSEPAGMVLTVEFNIARCPYVGLNYGPQFPFTETVSFQVACDDQAEADHLWEGLAIEGADAPCGWIKDRWGLSWQIVPRRMLELLSDPNQNRARRAMEATMAMVQLDIAALERAADGD